MIKTQSVKFKIFKMPTMFGTSVRPRMDVQSYIRNIVITSQPNSRLSIFWSILGKISNP